MPQKHIDELKVSLYEALYLDMEEFGLETEGDEIFSKFIGLWLRSAFQPIFRAEGAGAAIGHEALLRPAIGPDSVNPTFAFGLAENHGKLIKLDRVARTMHTLNYLNLPGERGLLFLNVHHKLLGSVNAHGKVFERILHGSSVPMHQVVIEMQESAIEIDKKLIEAVDNYRDRNYGIAIDNFGCKHSSLDRVWRICPDYIKLDGSIIRQAEANLKVRRVLPKLIEIATELGAQAVVQGIENEHQLQIALDAGAPLLQGFYLGRPATVQHLMEPPVMAQGAGQ